MDLKKLIDCGSIVLIDKKDFVINTHEYDSDLPVIFFVYSKEGVNDGIASWAFYCESKLLGAEYLKSINEWIFFSYSKKVFLRRNDIVFERERDLIVRDN